MAQNPGLEWHEKQFRPGADYYEIKKETDAFFEANQSMMTTANYNYKAYQRWKMFWENRVYKEGQTGGSFNYATEAMLHILNHSVCSNPPSNNSQLDLCRTGPDVTRPAPGGILCCGSEEIIWNNFINFIKHLSCTKKY